MSDYTSNLRSHYKFEDNGDDEEALYNGTLNGTPSFPTGVVDKCIQIDGSGNFETNYQDIVVGDDNTIAFWLFYSAVDSAISILDPSFLPYWPKVYLETTGYVFTEYDDNNAGVAVNYNSAADPVATGVWNHVAITTRHNAGNVYVKIYINGVSGSELNLGLYNGTDVANQPASIYNSSNAYKIDELRFYQRALTDSDILALYNFESPAVPPTNNTRGFFAVI